MLKHKKQKNFHHPLTLAIFTICLLVYIKEFMGFPVPQGFLTIVIFLCYLPLDQSDKVAFFLFLSAFSGGIPVYANCVLFSIFSLIDRYNEKGTHIKNTIMLSLLLLISCEVVMSIISIIRGYQEDVLKTCGFILVLTTITFRITDSYNEVRIKSIVISFAFGLFYCSTIIMLRDVTQNGIAAFLTSGMRFGRAYLDFDTKTLNQDNIMLYNPDTIGYYSVIALPAMLLVLMDESKLWLKGIYKLLLISILFYGVLSQSRAFIITLIILVVLYFLWGRGRKAKGTSFLLMLLIYIVTAKNEYIGTLYNTIRARFGSDSITGGRFEIIVAYINVMKANISSIMFGVGMQDYRLKFGIQTLPMVHNALFEIIVMWGFVGLGAVFLWLFILWKNIHIMHDGTYNKLVYLPLLGFAIFEQSQQFFAGYYQHLPIFMLCMLIIKCYCNEHYTEPVEAGIA